MLREQVTVSVEAGAALRLGGEPLDQSGHYYPLTVLTDAPGDAPARAEELFDPVAIVIRIEGEAKVVRVTNDVPYSLGMSV